MTIQSIKMPDIGEGIAEVELVAWRVSVGEAVLEDQILADVMTDKATVEIPSHVAGTVLSLDAAVGEVVAVGTPIIHIDTAAAPTDKGQPAGDSKEPTDSDVAKVSGTAATVQPSPQPSPSERGSDRPDAPAPADTLNDRGRNGATNSPPAASPPLTPGKGGGKVSERPIAAPAVRRRAWELGVDLATVRGTGPAGRITQSDLDAATSQTSANPSAVSAVSFLSPPSADPRYAQRTAEDTLPVIGLRRKIAHKMQEAKRRIPHFTYVEEVDVTELEALRGRLNTEFGKTRGRLTLLPFLIRALVLAVREHPEVNARYDDDAAIITRYAAVHLGMATQTDGGLMVPVIRHAESLDLWACAAEITRLAEAARAGRATRDELSGSTITLTSLGPLSGISHTPVINHPEVAIVGPNRIVERPVMLNGLVVARKMMNVSSSFDHRVVDGMNAAEFIQRLRGYLECPGTLMLG
ncbi:2-oxo acid dehydrogenase subunit E2 [Rhodoferax sp. U2-2l]|uniref:dihydrolipoamide acetyltransferase family protein n=1 Tax=Rhodoferax sp. U2-2l TaxID=2884000 RepID=UPI001D09D5EA|nr:dihydrolipoamide acetyltransferase family protein [Rhodoferax sp. U2-2l]MCB8746744.1 2-oxo acid dehydrogenase subunit E2 [Rhodoferax sp. U2-2l]